MCQTGVEIFLSHPSFEVIPFESYNNMVARVEKAGRTCYQSKSGKTKPEQFIKNLIKAGHHSVIEHAYLTVKFIIDRGVMAELTRHRIVNFSVQSTRYVDHSQYCPFIIPSWCGLSPGHYKVLSGQLPVIVYSDTKIDETAFPITLDSAERCFICALASAADSYNTLRQLYRWSPQQARSVLPNALKTEVVMTANLRQWRHVLQLRSHTSSHPDMYSIIRELKTRLVCEYPAFFNDLATPIL